ncbi:hypothetical protein T484DRAFT_1765285, partial [Baffinella frigidus]
MPLESDTLLRLHQYGYVVFSAGLTLLGMGLTICLATSATLEKLSISFALAQSTKLSALELRVEETFESTRLHPQ